MKTVNNKILVVLFSALAIFALSGCGSTGTASDDSLVGNGTTVNPNPTLKADAGVNQHIKTGTLVTLDASKSTDADHDLLTYSWTIVSKPAGSTAALSDSTSSHPTFTADADGDYVFELIVNDGTADSAPMRTTVTATPAHVNATPVADAGNDQHVKTHTTILVTLDGSQSSDADSDPLTYAWTLTSKPAGSSATLINPTSSHPTFTADIDGDYVFKLIVNDGTTDSISSTVTVTSSTTNSAPVADAGRKQNVKTHTTILVNLDGSNSSDADGDPLTYLWSIQSKPTGSSATLSDSTLVNPTFTADTDGDYVFKLIVNDGTTDSTASTVTVTSSTTNSLPVANAGRKQNVKTHTTILVHLDGSASSDADSDPLTYAWTIQSQPTGSTATLSDTSSATPSFTADTDGDYVFKLIVNDGTTDSTASTVTITSNTTNSTPVADAGASQPLSKTAGSTLAVTLDGSASSDADHDQITYSWTVQSAPKGSKVTALTSPTSAAPTFTADEEGTYVLKLIVNDGTTDSALATVTITVSHGNSIPVANAGLNQPLSKKVGDTLAVTLDGSKSSDGDHDQITYSWSVQSAPTNSTVTALTNPSSAAPTFIADLEGTYVLKLFVFDGHAPSAPDTVTITVSHGNSAPVANAGIDQPLSKTAGSTLAVTLDGSKSSDADHNQITYSWTVQSAPTKSKVKTLNNPTSATPTFTADEEGTYVLKLIVNDGTVDSIADTVTVTVSHTNSIPVADAGVDQHVKTHTATLVHLDGTASTDADGDTLTYSWSIQSKPTGSAVTLSDTASAAPSFTPDVDGTYVFKLFVFDGHAPSAPSTVTVTSSTTNATPVALIKPTATIASHIHDVTALLDGSQSSDADHDQLTYAWHFVSKPTGSSATLSSKITAKPSFVPDADGQYVVALVVSDGTVNSAESRVTVHVTSTDTAPVVDAGKNIDVTVVAGGTLISSIGATAIDSEDSNLTYAWTIKTRPAGDSTSGFSSLDHSTNTEAINQTSAGLTPSFRAMTAGQYVLSLTVNDNSNLNLSATDTMAITATLPHVNVKPVAHAGFDQHNVVIGSTVTLDGSKSSDPDSDPLTYMWTKVSDPSGGLTLGSDTTQHPTFTAPTTEGDYVFKLVVNDGMLNSDPNRFSQVTVTVVAALPPTILASPGAGSGISATGGRVPSPLNSNPLTTPVLNADFFDDPLAELMGTATTGNCPTDRPFVMQTLRNEGYATATAKVECANLTTCYNQWWLQSSDKNLCTAPMLPDRNDGSRSWSNLTEQQTCYYCVDPRTFAGGDISQAMNLLADVVWDKYSLQW